MSVDAEMDPSQLLRRSAKEERRLLRQEQQAETALLAAAERLARAELRLEKEQGRVERRRARVVAAIEELRRRQAARADGPDGWLPAAPPEPRAPVEQTSPPTRDDVAPLPATDAKPSTADASVAEPAPKRRTTRRRRVSTETSA